MRRFLLLLLVLIFLCSCSPESEPGFFAIATWNMAEFFDGRDDGTEFPEWSGKSGWNQDKFNERIEKSVMYILSNLADADLIVLEEIESEEVLVAMLEKGLKKSGYLYYGLAQTESGMLSVAFLSRVKPKEVALYSVPSSRPMLSLKMNVNGEDIHIVAVHLRSRLEEKNDGIRREELELIASIAGRETLPLVVLGDFNSDPTIHTSEMAGDRWGYNGEAIILLTGDGRMAEDGVLYSPYLDYASPLEGGTYFYEGRWEKLDNVLLSSHFFDGESIEFRETRIVKGSGSADYSGKPIKYSPKSGSGMSDHFALLSYFSV